MTVSAPDSVGQDAVDRGRRSILGNFRSVVVGRLFASLSMWLALVVLAKLSDPTTVGIYALAQAICIPVAEVARLALREILSSDTTRTHRFGVYLALRLLAAGIALAIMVTSGLLQVHSVTVAWVIAIYALTRCLELVSDMIYGLFQVHERMDYIGRSLCLLGPLSLLFLTLGYWVSGSLVVAVAGQLLAQTLVLMLYDVPMGRRQGQLRPLDALRPIWDWRSVRGLALQSVPLAFATLLVTFSIYLPRLAVEQALGLSALGYFAALGALAMAPSRFVNSMGIAMSVRLAENHAAGERAAFVGLLGRLVAVIGACGALGVAAAVAFGGPILQAVYTADFAAHASLFGWLVASAVLRCMADVLRYGMVATRRFWWIAFQYGVVALVAAVSCLTLIPRFGLTGAGATMFLIFASHLLVVAAGLFRSLPVPARSEVA
jgi:O-antigen/teichoic acid export membrane protein